MPPHARSSRQTQVVEPPHDLDEMVRLANFVEQHSAPAALIGPDGEHVPLPLPVYEALKRVVDAMERGASVSLADRSSANDPTGGLASRDQSKHPYAAPR